MIRRAECRGDIEERVGGCVERERRELFGGQTISGAGEIQSVRWGASSRVEVFKHAAG